MADTIEERIIENLLNSNGYIYLRADSIDWGTKKGEYWRDKSFKYKFYMYSTKAMAATTTTAYHNREVRYNDLPLIGKLLAHKGENEDGVSILEFLAEIQAQGVDDLVYDNEEVRKVSIKKILEYYNYESTVTEPRKLMIDLCDYKLFSSPNCARHLNRLEFYLDKHDNGYVLISEFYKNLSFADCFHYLALCPYFEETYKDSSEWEFNYLQHFKEILEFVVFSYFLYNDRPIYVLLDENSKPVLLDGALQVLYKSTLNANLLPVNDIELLKTIMRDNNTTQLIYTDGEGYSAYIREDIINGMIPTIYFAHQGGYTSKVFNTNALKLPQDIKDKMLEEFEKRKLEDQHTPNPIDAGYFAREYGYTYEQYIKYVINGEKD